MVLLPAEPLAMRTVVSTSSGCCVAPEDSLRMRLKSGWNIQFADRLRRGMNDHASIFSRPAASRLGGWQALDLQITAAGKKIGKYSRPPPPTCMHQAWRCRSNRDPRNIGFQQLRRDDPHPRPRGPRTAIEHERGVLAEVIHRRAVGELADGTGFSTSNARSAARRRKSAGTRGAVTVLRAASYFKFVHPNRPARDGRQILAAIDRRKVMGRRKPH